MLFSSPLFYFDMVNYTGVRNSLNILTLTGVSTGCGLLADSTINLVKWAVAAAL